MRHYQDEKKNAVANHELTLNYTFIFIYFRQENIKADFAFDFH